jgi:hypothetical protein
MKGYSGYLLPYKPLIAAMILCGQSSLSIARLLHAIGARGYEGLEGERAAIYSMSGIIRSMNQTWETDRYWYLRNKIKQSWTPQKNWEETMQYLNKD